MVLGIDHGVRLRSVAVSKLSSFELADDAGKLVLAGGYLATVMSP
mgnify:CR=1 FL=1